MKYEFSSKALKIFMWVSVAFMTILDSATYVIVIVPDRIGFDFFDHFVFAAWFIVKIVLLAILVLGKGPLKLCIYIMAFIILMHGLYCGFWYPMVDGEKIDGSTYVYWVIAIVGLLYFYLAAKKVVLVQQQN